MESYLDCCAKLRPSVWRQAHLSFVGDDGTCRVRVVLHCPADSVPSSLQETLIGSESAVEY